MIACTCALWIFLSFWVAVSPILRVLDGIVLTASMGMCMWSHYVTMTTDPGMIPLKKNTGSSADCNVLQRDDGNDNDGTESELEEEDVELTLEEFENMEDDGSMLTFCDACNIYRPPR
jgi:hypothetical protein